MGSYLTVAIRGGQTIPPGEYITSHLPSPSSLLQIVEHNTTKVYCTMLRAGCVAVDAARSVISCGERPGECTYCSRRGENRR